MSLIISMESVGSTFDNLRLRQLSPRLVEALSSIFILGLNFSSCKWQSSQIQTPDCMFPCSTCRPLKVARLHYQLIRVQPLQSFLSLQYCCIHRSILTLPLILAIPSILIDDVISTYIASPSQLEGWEHHPQSPMSGPPNGPRARKPLLAAYCLHEQSARALIIHTVHHIP